MKPRRTSSKPALLLWLVVAASLVACAKASDSAFGSNDDHDGGADYANRGDAGGAREISDGGDGADALAENCPTASWVEETSGTTLGLAGVFAIGGDVYVGGSNGVMLSSIGDGTWTLGENVNPAAGINKLWGPAVGDVYASWGAGGILHLQNGAWNIEGASLLSELEVVWGPGTGEVYAPTVEGKVAYRNTAGTWIEQGMPVANALFGIWGSSADDIYVCGNQVLMHKTGTGSWTEQTPAIEEGFEALWGSASNDVFVVGTAGSIQHSTGDGTWVSQASHTTSNLMSIWGSSANDIYAVGDDGTIVHSTGDGNWGVETSGTTQRLYSVSGTSSCNVYAVGNGGTILHRH